MTDYEFLTDSGIPRISSISASQALRASSSTPSNGLAPPLPTGLDRLDDALRSIPTATTGYPTAASSSSSPGGIPRGSITEIYGPPGVGKTAISLNIAANTLAARDNEHVVWIDTGSPIPTLRLKEMLTSKLKASSPTQSNKPIDQRLHECMTRFHHLRVPSLPHLLALFAHPPANFPAEGTSLVIVDSISAPFQSYFPNATELKSRLAQQQQGGLQQGSENQQKQTTQWLLNRKWNVTSDLANKMVKLATPSPPNRPHKLAIILLNQTQTKIRGQPRPTLYPAVGGGPSWENCIHTRIALYRDWWIGSAEDSITPKARYAEVMKRAGKVISVRTDSNIFPFVVEDDGLRELHNETNTTTNTQQQQSLPPDSTNSNPLLPPSSIPIPQSTSTLSVRKRKVDEIADSEEEDDDLDSDDDDNIFADDDNEDDIQWDNNNGGAAVDSNKQISG